MSVITELAAPATGAGATSARAGRATWARRTSFRLVVATQVLVLGGSNLATPLFPLYERTYGFGPAMVTLLFGVYVAALIPSMLTLGRITDRVGRRPALAAGVALTAASSLAFAGARNVGWLFAGEIVYGVAAGLVMSASTVAIRELHPREDAGSGALVAMVAACVGLTVGPLLSGTLATVTPWPTVAPFVVHIVAAGALALALLRIPETRPDVAVPVPVVPASPRALAAPAAPGRVPGRVPSQVPTRVPVLHVPPAIRRPWTAATLASLTAWMLNGWILGLSPSFLHEQLGVRISQPVVAGLFAAAVLAASGATQIVLRRHHHKPASVKAGMVLILVGLAVFTASSVAGGLVVALAGGIIAGLGTGLVHPSTMAIVQRIAPDHARGGVTSAFLAASYLGLSVPVVAAGLAAGAAGVDLGTVAAWYLAGMAVLVVAAFLAQPSARHAAL